MNLIQFGQTVKAKYPEYKDTPDDVLGKLMLQKYPEYSSMVDDPATQPSFSGNRANDIKQDIMKNQGKNVAKYDAYYDAVDKDKVSTARPQNYLQPTGSAQISPQNGKRPPLESFIIKDTATPAPGVKGTVSKNPEEAVRKQGGNWLANAAGGVGKFFFGNTINQYDQAIKGVKQGASIASDKSKSKEQKAKELVELTASQRKDQDKLKVKTGLELGSIVTPAGKGVKGMIAAGGVSGMLRGAADDKDGNPLPEILAGGVGGMAAGGVIGGTAKLLRGLTHGIPERIMNTVFKEPLKETKAAVKGATSLGNEALKRGVKGSSEQILDKSNKAIAHLEDNLQEALYSSTKKVSTKEILKTAKPLIDQYTQSGNTTAATSLMNRIKSIEDEVGEMIPAARANEIKRTLYDEARKAYGTEASANMEGLKAIARSIKEQLADIPGVGQINKDLSFYGKAVDSMTDKLAREGRNNLAGLTDTILGTGAVVSGSPLAIGAVVSKHLLGSTGGKTRIANTLSNAGNTSLPPIITNSGSKVAQIGAAKLGLSVVGQQPPKSPQDQSNYKQNPPHIITDSNTLPPESQALPPITVEKEYITGRSPEEWNQAYTRAMEAGDEATAKYYENQFAKEVKNQSSGGTGAKKNAKQQSFSNAALAGQQALNLLNQGGVSTGIGQGLIGKFGEKTGWNSDTQTEYRSAIGLARTTARNALLGANMTDKELESVSAAIPEFNDAPNVAKKKLETFVRIMTQFGQNFEGVADQPLPEMPTEQ